MSLLCAISFSATQRKTGLNLRCKLVDLSRSLLKWTEAVQRQYHSLSSSLPPEPESITSFLATLASCDQTEIDQQMQERCKFSKEAVTRLVTAITAVQDNNKIMAADIQNRSKVYILECIAGSYGHASLPFYSFPKALFQLPF